MSHCAPEATLKPKRFEFTLETVTTDVFVAQVYWEAVPKTWPGGSKVTPCSCEMGSINSHAGPFTVFGYRVIYKKVYRYHALTLVTYGINRLTATSTPLTVIRRVQRVTTFSMGHLT